MDINVKRYITFFFLAKMPRLLNACFYFIFIDFFFFSFSRVWKKTNVLLGPKRNVI